MKRRSITVNELKDILEQHFGYGLLSIDYIEIASELNMHDPIMKMVGGGGILNIYYSTMESDA